MRCINPGLSAARVTICLSRISRLFRCVQDTGGALSDQEAALQCIQCVAARKAQAQCEQLRLLGFEEWQAAAAVHTHGCNLEAALVWLLMGHGRTPEDAQRVVGTTGAGGGGGRVTRVLSNSGWDGCWGVGRNLRLGTRGQMYE